MNCGQTDELIRPLQMLLQLNKTVSQRLQTSTARSESYSGSGHPPNVPKTKVFRQKTRPKPLACLA